MGFFAGPEAAYAPIPPSRNNQIARDPNTLWPDGRRDGRASGLGSVGPTGEISSAQECNVLAATR
jgi:hypothetical protein